MNQRYFNVFKPTGINGVMYSPKKSYRITRANELAVTALEANREAFTTAFEIDFTALNKAADSTKAQALPDTTSTVEKGNGKNGKDESEKGGL